MSSTLASAGFFCALRLRLGWEPARSKFLFPRPGRRKQRPAAFPRFDSGVSILRDLDEVARPVLNESGGIQVEFGPGNATLNQRHAALVGLDVEDGREGGESLLLCRLKRRLLNHRFTIRCKHPQQGQEAIFNGGRGQRHWSFQPMEESKSFISPAGGMQRRWPVVFEYAEILSPHFAGIKPNKTLIIID